MLGVRWLLMWTMTRSRLGLEVPAAGCAGDQFRYGRRTGARGPVILGGMEQDPSDAVDASDVFDHELTRVLQVHGHALEKQSRTLLATGEASIAVPEVILRARLRAPRGWRRGLLEIATENPVTGAITHSSSRPTGRAGHDRASLLREITIDLALELTYGPASGAA
jgi:hypothetical protein